MGDARIIMKCIRVKRILDKMAVAKENRIRELVGLGPRQSLLDACFGGTCACIRECLCIAFCPCCVGGGKSASDEGDDGEGGGGGRRPGFFKKLCTTGEFYNELLKCFLNFLYGVGLSMALYLFLCLQMKANMEMNLFIGLATGFVFSVGMGFSRGFRCIVFLTLPNFCTSRGRGVLLMYCMVLVMNHPVQNFSFNLDVLSEAETCGAQLVMNETKKIVRTVAAPLLSIIRGIKAMLHACRMFAKKLKQAFNALKKAVKQIAATIKKMFSWLKNMTNVCNWKVGAPYRKCKKAFDDAYRRCCKVMWIFDFLCYIVKIVGYICNIVRIGELMCLIVDVIRTFVVEKIAKPIKEKIVDLKEMFYFSVTLNYQFHYNMNQSRSFAEVREAIMSEIKEKLTIVLILKLIIDNLMPFTVLLVIARAFLYRRGYVHKDGFDNHYLTRYLFEIEHRRQERDMDTIFPLRNMEKYTYMPTFTYWMTKKELKKLVKGILTWLFAAFNAVYYIVCDYCLWWILDLIKRHMDIRSTSDLPPHLQMHVRGKGPTANMFRSMVGVIQPASDQGLLINTSPCLPHPSTPNYTAYKIIAILLTITFFLTIFQPYVLRLRHVVGASYYPHRERFRAVWLYNRILVLRGSFKVFMRRQLRRKLKNERSIQKISFTARLMAQFKICKILCKFLGYRRKFCLSCGTEGKIKDMINFIHCDNCKSPYCNECFIALGNICTACMNPVDYGDTDDVSVVTDSSQDEQDRYVRVSNMEIRKKRALQRQKQRQPKHVLKAAQKQFTLTGPDPRADYNKFKQFSSTFNMGGHHLSSSSESLHSVESPAEESTSQYDTDYQYLSKASSPSHSEDEQWPRRRRLTKPKIQKVTMDIFNKHQPTCPMYWRTFEL